MGIGQPPVVGKVYNSILAFHQLLKQRWEVRMPLAIVPIAAAKMCSYGSPPPLPTLMLTWFPVLNKWSPTGQLSHGFRWCSWRMWPWFSCLPGYSPSHSNTWHLDTTLEYKKDRYVQHLFSHRTLEWGRETLKWPRCITSIQMSY